MNLLEKLKDSYKAYSETQKARKEVYERTYEEQYKKELVKKAKKDAYNKVNGIKPENKKSRIQIGLYDDISTENNQEKKESIFSR